MASECCRCLYVQYVLNSLCVVLLDNSKLLSVEKSCGQQDSVSAEEVTPKPMSKNSIAEALQRTSKAIEDIDAVIAAASLT